MSKISFSRILLSLFILNAVGIALRYFELDTFIIVAGFRFHLSFVLPILILFPKNFLQKIKVYFIDPDYKGKILPFILVLFAIGLPLLALYLLEKIDIADPEYFYEFGLSSIVDYPIYLIWNFPQFILLFTFFSLSLQERKMRFLNSFLFSLLLFAYEFVPFEIKNINYIPFAELILSCLIVSILITFYSNIYWFVFALFSVLWTNLLAFGSKSETLINLLFAARYNEWEGFFTVNKLLSPYLTAAQMFILVLLLFIALPLRTQRS